MARNAEIVRQWRLLRELEGSRGVTIRQMADLTGVTTRTIRRDLDALQEAGFALYDEAVESEKRWKLRHCPLLCSINVEPPPPLPSYPRSGAGISLFVTQQ